MNMKPSITTVTPTRRKPAKSPSRASAVKAGAAEQTEVEVPSHSHEELVRQAAYAHFEGRGCSHGHDLDDWLKAEAEIERLLPTISASAPGH